MTLIVALRGRDGLVLAADSRGTVGDPRGLTAINDGQTKLFRLSNYCGIGISGSSELAATLVDELLSGLSSKGKPHEYADDLLNETRNIVRRRYDDWFSKIAKAEERPAVLLTIVGFARARDGQLVPRTYLLSSQLDFAPQLFPTGNCLSGIPQYAVYLLHRLYNPDMGVENLSRLAAYLIAETASQDPKVGGPIRIAKLTSAGGFEELAASEVDRIVQLNAEQNEQLKKFFFGGEPSAN